jgi:hypothetical protein
MAQGAKRRAGSRQAARRTPEMVEGTALVSLSPVGAGDVARIAKAMRGLGLSDVRQAKIILSRSAAGHVASGRGTAVPATIIAGETAEVSADATPEQDLARALAAASARGDALKQDMLADPEMLSSAELARRLGMSQEGVRLKRKRHEVLGLELAKRGIRYPAWQVVEHQQLLPALPRLFEVLGDDPWTVYVFLLQHHPELDGARALDALRRGRIDRVIATAGNVASGAFA